jgi:DNA repair ATPase RecN
MSLDPVTRAAIISGAATAFSVVTALLGVFGNLWWNRRQYRDEKSLNLRRDVYLNAIEVINRASSFAITQIHPLEPKEKDEDKMTPELSGISAKLHILGSKQLVSAVIAFQAAFDDWITKIKKHRTIVPEIDKIEKELRKHIENSTKAVNELTKQGNEVSKLVKDFKVNPEDKEGSRKRGEEILKIAASFAEQKTNVQTELNRLTEERRNLSETICSHRRRFPIHNSGSKTPLATNR